MPVVLRVLIVTLVLPILFTPLVPRGVRLVLGPLLLLIVAFNLYALRLIRRRKWLTWIGVGGVTIDIVLMCIVPLSFYSVDLGHQAPPILVSKTHFPVLCGMFIALNGASTRPIYPALATVGAVMSLGVLVVLSLNMPSAHFTTDMKDVLLGDGVALHVVALQAFFLTAAGTVLTLFNRSMRRAVVSAAHEEAERARTRERHAKSIMDAKMDALVRLVAGVSHEVNTPLGSARSSLATQRKALEKLEKLPSDAVQKRERFLRAVQSGIDTADDALGRIDAVVDKLSRFTRLDEAEYKKTDVSELVANAVAMVPAAARRDVRFIFEPEPHVIECFPAGLSQVLLTLLTNAFEAVDDDGEVTVRLVQSQDELTITIADDGRGISEERLEHLFDVDFARAGNRVAAAFGLPTCHAMVRQHGGEIVAESRVGEGTTFTITLPAVR